MSPVAVIKSIARSGRFLLERVLHAYPKLVQCNICGWQGRHFSSDCWHKHINCPRCRLSIRHRLLACALQYTEGLSKDDLTDGKRVLHFAPEHFIRELFSEKAAQYQSTDFLRRDCELRLDMSNMQSIHDGAFDLVVACDVLEHVPDYLRAVEETHRVLSPDGCAVFTVPQKDDLVETFEDPDAVTPQQRERIFGQWDHLRIFGSDFPKTLESKGFHVTSVNEGNFPAEIVERHVLFPPVLSEHPLATNHRQVFFARKR